MVLKISELMESSGVRFGTSGARGRVVDMTDQVCYAYTTAFIQHLRQTHGMQAQSPIALAGDFRSSTPRIMAAAAQAIRDAGHLPVNCGHIPSPAVACYGIARGIPSLMVTGSHIPDDRNGIKFNLPSGEILKQDERGIASQQVEIPPGRFDHQGGLMQPGELPGVEPEAYAHYVRRYLCFFPAGSLAGMRIGLYEHSSVARAAYREVMEGLGAEVVPLGRSETFVPVDTEAIRPEDVTLAARWARDYRLDAIVSADGDGDRPLVADEQGEWLRGDVAGVLCASYLGVEAVVTPISSNTVVERCGYFRDVARTCIGSPFVIEAMERAKTKFAAVAGYEANGGFLLASPLSRNGRSLAALPTRDAIIVALTILLSSREKMVSVRELCAELPPRFTASDRVQEVPPAVSSARIADLLGTGTEAARRNIQTVFGSLCGTVADIDRTDGLRVTFANGEIIHLRPSGNAPELRCYNEADTAARARKLNESCMAILASWRPQ